MAAAVSVHFLPSLATPEELAGGDVVMIDVLRASTTIVQAISAGAKCVIPCREVEEARGMRETITGEPVVVGGERGGLPIEGFDLGNSPGEYIAEVVRGKTIAFTTTNGTLALMQCRSAAHVFIGAFVNLSAVVKRLTGVRPIHLLCAGTRGRITREDVLCAGALCERLLGTVADTEGINDQARIALSSWRAAVPDQLRCPSSFAPLLAQALLDTQGGRNLTKIGLAHDIYEAAQIDRFHIVPELDLASWRIVAR
jgi:2-phosphosulfolactate phosphatase